MINQEHTLKNHKGITLIELLVSIVVSSLVLITLVQILMLSLAAKTQLDQDTRLSNEAHVIATTIENQIFNLEPQQIEVITDTVDETIIEIRHLYDVTTDVDGKISRDFSNPITHTLRLDLTTGVITYNDGTTTTQLNGNSITILPGSSIELIPVNSSICSPSLGPCDEGILKLTLVIEIVLSNGFALPAQTYITTILV